MDSSFVDHEEEIPTMNTYSCDSCGKTYKALANLKRHLDDTHSKQILKIMQIGMKYFHFDKIIYIDQM
jgi:hypothetical protein